MCGLVSEAASKKEVYLGFLVVCDEYAQAILTSWIQVFIEQLPNI